MNHSISRKFDKLEKEKSEILEFLKGKDEKDLLRAAPGKWSLIQAMRHIQISESQSLAYMQKKSQAGDEMPSEGFKAQLNLQILFLVFGLRLRFKAPAVLKNPEQTSLGELENDWNLTRKEMKKFLNDFPSNWESKAVYRHPFTGRMSLDNALRFFIAHQRHHRRQLGRIEKQLRRL